MVCIKARHQRSQHLHSFFFFCWVSQHHLGKQPISNPASNSEGRVREGKFDYWLLNEVSRRLPSPLVGTYSWRRSPRQKSVYSHVLAFSLHKIEKTDPKYQKEGRGIAFQAFEWGKKGISSPIGLVILSFFVIGKGMGSWACLHLLHLSKRK